MAGKHAQSAIEYLTTYGWAILIMLVAVVMLFWLGLVSPKTPLQSSCMFPSDMLCQGYVLNSSGNYGLDLGQATGHAIRVTRIACTAENTPSAWNTLQDPITIASGDHQVIAGGPQSFCYKEDGTTIADGRAGGMYKGRIFIEYVELDSGYVHQIAGDVSLKYEDVPVPSP